MAVDIEKERAVETFKSLIQISVAGFKMLALLNGGAAIAILAYLGNIAGKGQPTPDMILPMGFYLAGLFLCGLAYLGSYMTQLSLFNEAMGRKPEGSHQRWLYSTVVVVGLSLVAFAIGSYFATVRFGGIKTVPNVHGAESGQFLAEPYQASLNWEGIAALSSAAIALCAFGVTIWQVRTSQKRKSIVLTQTN